MANLTQCPHCFSSFEITDEQYLKSRGEVQCGICHQAFHAVLLPEEAAHPANVLPEEMPKESGQFNFGDDLDLTEITQDPDSSLGETQHSNILKSSSLPMPMHGADEKSLDSESPELIAEFLRNAVTGKSSEEQDYTGLFETHSFPSFNDSVEDNIHSELTISMDDDDLPVADDSAEHRQAQPDKAEFSQTELDLPRIDDIPEEPDPHYQETNADSVAKDQHLISEVDARLDNKLSEEKQSLNLKQEPTFDSFEIADSVRSSTLSRWLFAPLLSIAVILLLASLTYQLWLRQATPLLENEKVPELLGPILDPLAEQLSKRLGVTFPNRRDLGKLQLLSARTEAHPTRSSTILLRVNLINHARIAQPYPWLELSLTDKEGRLVSRRALSPQDYLHNNRLQGKINANELQAITIELLAFPKNASGYALTLLNN